MVTKVLLSMLSTAQKICFYLTYNNLQRFELCQENLEKGESDEESINVRFSAFSENNQKLLRAVCSNRGG